MTTTATATTTAATDNGDSNGNIVIGITYLNLFVIGCITNQGALFVFSVVFGNYFRFLRQMEQFVRETPDIPVFQLSFENMKKVEIVFV